MTSAAARTWLFVPGDRADRFAKATGAGASAVIIDLEDAVSPDHKPRAREAAAEWVADQPAWIRVNGSGTPWHEADLARVDDPELHGLRGVVVPMAEVPAALVEIRNRTQLPLVALIETAHGIEAAADLAAVDGVVRLAFGSIDYAVDIGSDETRDALLLARSRLVVASRVAGLPGPIDSVTTDLTDPKAAGDDARYARSLGFGGKLCIHPVQIRPVDLAFRPTEAEIEWARRVLAAGESGGAVQVGGAMVDQPVLLRARRIIGSAELPSRS